MTNIRKYVALTTAIAFIALGQSMNAQDDLDDLLADLEGGAPSATPAQAEAPAAEAPAAETPAAEAPAAEEPAAEEPAAETPAAEAPAAETPAAETPAAEEPAAETPATEEPAAETPAAEEPAAETPATEEPAAETPAAEEPAAETPATEEPAAETPAAEEPAAETPAIDESAASEDKKADDAINLLNELAAEEPDKAETPAAPKQVAETPAAKEPATAAAASPVSLRKDGKLIDEILTAEKLRREAMDTQAMREIREAKDAMASGEYIEAVRHYGHAVKLLNDSQASEAYKNECREGIAEGLYKAALEEDRTGRRERAVRYMEKAVDLRHPKARRQLEAWKNAEDPDAHKTDSSEISHIRNDADYKERRENERRHLKRAKQLLAQREIDRALEECEFVLSKNPYNEEALRLRGSITRKRDAIHRQERDVSREAWIADVDKAWHPPYAVDVREPGEKKGVTVKKAAEGSDGLTPEQMTIQRMKSIIIPSAKVESGVPFSSAIDYVMGLANDYDSPSLPESQKGFSYVIKYSASDVQADAPASNDDSDGFSDTDSETSADNSSLGTKVGSAMSVQGQSFYEILQTICLSSNYKFVVQGNVINIMPKDMSSDALVTRTFPVLATFLEKMSGARADISESLHSSAFGASNRRKDEGEGEDQERDWKEVFSLLGVKWPEGSSIFFMKTLGKLFVKNTQENLAEIENLLKELGGQIKLIEIETRFIEVCQEDLNSLGFEWILNSDYTIGLNKHLAKALGVRGGTWGDRGSNDSNSHTYSSSSSFGGNGNYNYNSDTLTQNSGKPSTLTSEQSVWGRNGQGVFSSSHNNTRTTYDRSSGADWISNRGGSRNAGVGAIQGVSDFGDTANMSGVYSTGQRYLSTLNNHISGRGNAYNDQFMRLNAFLGSADLSMILHMLSQRSDTDLLSAPKVLARPGEDAKMRVVTEYIYPTDFNVQLQSASSGSGGYNSGGGQSAILAVVEPDSFTTRDVGVTLTVTPTLTDDGNVIDLELKTEIVSEPTWKNYGMKIPFTGNSSQLQNFEGIGDILTGLGDVLTALGAGLSEEVRTSFANTAVNSASRALDNLTTPDEKTSNITYYEAPMEQPFFHVRELESKLSVYPGATIVMGGLITESRQAMDDKIPFLGDIPFLGRLFRSHSELTTKRNLLIFVTTRVVDGRGREISSEELNLGDKIDVIAAPEASVE